MSRNDSPYGKEVRLVVRLLYKHSTPYAYLVEWRRMAMNTLTQGLIKAADLFDPPPNPYLDDPVGWVNDELDEFLWSMQAEVLESVRDTRYTAVQSCHSVGKSFIASRLAAWWLGVHPVGSAFVVTTAPSQPQVEAILWRYIRQAHRKAELPGRINLDCEWYMGADELVAYGRKPANYTDPTKAATAFQGIHTRYVLVILDEACGIPEWLWNAVDSLVTNADSRVLAIGNPDDPSAHFATVCAPGSGWNHIQIGYDDTPNFTGEDVPEELAMELIDEVWVEERRQRWGEDNPLFVSKVLGEFPVVADDVLITPAMLRAAYANDLSASALDTGQGALDVARYGSDETVLYRNRGGMIRKEFAHRKKDTMQTAGRLMKFFKRTKSHVPVWVDIIGLGAGVFDRCYEQDTPVLPFQGSEKASEPAKYKNKRAEAYWTVRELAEDGLLDLDQEDEELAAQLGAIKWSTDSAGRIVIESKEKMAKRGMPSPNNADAVSMACVKPPATYNPADVVVKGKKATLTAGLKERLM